MSYQIWDDLEHHNVSGGAETPHLGTKAEFVFPDGLS